MSSRDDNPVPGWFIFGCLFFLLVQVETGCISEPNLTSRARLVGDAAPSAKQRSDCEAIKGRHNGWQIAAAVFGTLGAAGGASTFVQDKTAQEAMGISAVVAGSLAVGAGALAGSTAETYSLLDCDAVLAPK